MLPIHEISTWALGTRACPSPGDVGPLPVTLVGASVSSLTTSRAYAGAGQCSLTTPNPEALGGSRSEIPSLWGSAYNSHILILLDAQLHLLNPGDHQAVSGNPSPCSLQESFSAINWVPVGFTFFVPYLKESLLLPDV